MHAGTKQDIDVGAPTTWIRAALVGLVVWTVAVAISMVPLFVDLPIPLAALFVPVLITATTFLIGLGLATHQQWARVGAVLMVVAVIVPCSLFIGLICWASTQGWD